MGRHKLLGTTIGATLVASVIAGCGMRPPSVAGHTSSAAHTTPSTYCVQILASKPAPQMPFDEEAPIIRAAASAAPHELRADVAVVLNAYEQIQDSEDGVISMDRVTVPGTAAFITAMADIDDYTSKHCGVHIAQQLPVLPVN